MNHSAENHRRLTTLSAAGSNSTPVFLSGHASWPDVWHEFEAREILALKTSIASGRPLLIRGEPGIGKSQIARAAAVVLQMPFLPFVVNATCECGDLLFAADPVARLAQAHLLGARNQGDTPWEDKLDESRFVAPRALWWAFNWKTAKERADKLFRPIPEPAQPAAESYKRGCVVLIDEIDKAETDLPNGLLESLGNEGFEVPQASVSVALHKEQGPPLIVITTNEERELPAAFVRRCVVLQLLFPQTEAEAKAFLIRRGKSHFKSDNIDDRVWEQAAVQLLKDRAAAPRGQPKPGAAEFLDMIRALRGLARGDTTRQLELLAEISEFVYRKQAADSGK